MESRISRKIWESRLIFFSDYHIYSYHSFNSNPIAWDDTTMDVYNTLSATKVTNNTLDTTKVVYNTLDTTKVVCNTLGTTASKVKS